MKNRWKQNPIIWKKQNFDSIKKTNPGKESIMERRSMWSRLLAIVLAVSMVFSSQSMSVFADTLAIIQQPQDTNEKKNQPADDTSKDNQETSEESEEETTAAEEPQQSEPAEESSEAQQEQTVQMTGTINGENVNLRSEPSTSSEVLSKAQTGDVVSILGEVTGDDGNTWYEILYGQGSAFVSAEFVTVTEAESESETEAATEPETAAEEETQSEAAKKAARKARTANTKNEYATPGEAAEAYFGKNATNPQSTAQVFISQVSGGTTVRAGDVLTYRISYSMAVAPAFNYGDQPLSLFDTYEGTVIYLNLPDGLSLMNPNSVKASYNDELGRWEIPLSESMTAIEGQGGSFSIQLKVDDNGELKIGENFDFNIQKNLSIKTSFTVLDKTDADNPKEIGFYEPDVPTTSTLPALTSTSDDYWKIGKEYVANTPNKEENTWTVTFRLKVGLGDVANTSTEPLDPVSDPEAYSRNGRVPIGSVEENGNLGEIGKITLKENLSLTDRNNKPVVPNSVVITEEFGARSSYRIENQASFSQVVNLDTCGANGLSETEVDPNAPYYSTYLVEVEYPYQVFEAEYSDSNKADLDVQNRAEISYFRKGETDKKTDEASANHLLGTVTEPARLTIRKEILDYEGKTKGLYTSATEWGKVSGPAVFTIKDKDGNPVDCYLYDEETKEAHKITGKISIDPDGTVSGTGDDTSAVGTEGAVTVYLDPGKEYTVTEESCPSDTTPITASQTVDFTESNEQTVTFQNKELLGKIIINKKGQEDGQLHDLDGAEFTLYTTNEQGERKQIAQGTTANGGKLEFDQLEPGTYYVKEIKAPSKYLLDETEYTVVISKENNEISIKVQAGTGEVVPGNTITSTNVKNQAYLKLEKYRYWYSQTGTGNENWELVGNDFNGTFILQRSTNKNAEDAAWEDVAGVSVSLTNGEWIASKGLEVYKDNVKSQPYYYRFKEILGDNWHASGEKIDSEGNRCAYSEGKTLVAALGKGSADATVFEMRNTQNGTITLTKKLVSIQSNGNKPQTVQQGVTFELYKKNKEGYEKVELTNNTTDAKGQIVASDLQVWEEDGKTPVKYYWVETGNSTGQILESGREGVVVDTINVNGEDKQALGPCTFVSSTGSELNYQLTALNVEQKVPVKIKKTGAGGSFVDGAKVQVEKQVNGTWEKVDLNGDGNKENDTQEIPEGGLVLILDTGFVYQITEVEAPEHYDINRTPIKIDLTDKTVRSTGSDLIDDASTVIHNTQKPSIKITKLLKKADDTTEATMEEMKDVTFGVYTSTDGKTFTPLMKADESDQVTLTAGETLYLDAGTYYLKETVTEGMNVLDPSKYPDLYEGKGVRAGESFYFGPYILTDENRTKTLTGTITNISSLGVLQVTKTDDKGGPLSGAEIEISYQYNGTQITKTVKSDGNGIANFENLPIYHTDGKTKVVYTIREKTAPSTYYKTDAAFTATLKPEEIVRTGLRVTEPANPDADEEPLVFVNKPYTTFTIQKVYYDKWEHEFTDTELALEGAEIALYKKEGDSYKLVETKATDSLGQVVFKNLTHDDGDEYVAVEYSIPDTGLLIEPAAGKYLKEDYPTAAPDTLTAEQIKAYNTVTRDEKDTSVVKTMENVIHWTQIRAYKYKVVTDKETGEEKEVPQNHATFELWKQEVTDGATELAFKEENCEYVGTYTSGTLSDENGTPQKGWFATDILDVADNIVYWLVETKAGPGAEIIPENQYTLFYRGKGTPYTNKTIGKDGVENKAAYPYPDDAYTTGVEIENNPVYGGEAPYIATIRISKWAGEEGTSGKEDATFRPLGGAKYELWLLDQEGTPVKKVDDLTVGLESEIADDETSSLTSFAISDTLYYTDGFEEYGTQGEDGNYYVPMAIREVYAPEGYQMDSRYYYLTVCFEHATEEVKYNDQYFVATADKEAPLAEDLGEKESVGYNDPSRRLANWPSTGHAVTVNKYGYQPNETTIGQKMDADALDAYFAQHSGRTPLSGVTMKLQRWNGTAYQDYQYAEGENKKAGWGTKEFTVNSAGSFTFPLGLEAGKYRIIETSVPAAYEKFYDGSSDAAARYFEVTNRSVTVNMYNPEKISIQLQKTGLDGTTPVPGVTFKLMQGETAKYSANTVDGGIASFRNITTGTYYLQEENGAGYSAAYLSQYFKEYYKDTGLVDFVEKKVGLKLGYEYGVDPDSKERTITAVKDLTSYGLEKDSTLTIRNPQLVSFTIKKTDEQNNPLTGAEFTVHYLPFDVFSGSFEIAGKTNRWEKKTYTVEDASGELKLTGLDPGVYYIEETKAPTDKYDKAEEGKLLVLTGGMSVQITLNGEALPAEQVKTGDATENIMVTFVNPKKASLTITKKVDAGSLGEPESYKATIKLYDSPNATEPTAVLEPEKGKPASYEGLSQGKTYYLEEVIADDSDYCLMEIKINGEKATADSNGRYAFTPKTRDDIEIEVTNQYLYAEMSVLKVDSSDGTPLSGAEFEILKDTGETEEDKEGNLVPVYEAVTAEWTENKGIYTARIQMEDNQPANYVIREKKAPTGYVKSDGEIKVTLTAGDKKEVTASWSKDLSEEELLKNYIVPNDKGATIQITKFNNMKDTGGTPQKDVVFRLYLKEGDNYKFISSAKTNEDGIAVLTLTTGNEYAIAEEALPEGYIALQGIWENETDKELTPVGKDGDRTLYGLGAAEDLQAGETYFYNAYNIPYTSLEVRKTDAVDATVIPKARVAVYQLEETPEKTEGLTKAEVDALKANKTPIFSGTTEQENKEGHYSYVNNIPVVPGTTYLIVEEEVTGGYTEKSMILDDNRVHWYEIKTIPEGTTTPTVVTLKNIQGKANLGLTKETTVTEELPSLYDQNATITYRLKPTVENNTYGLKEFVLTDTGLKAFHQVQKEQDQEETEEWQDVTDYLNENYSIRHVVLDPASHETDMYGISEAQIQATVTFLGFDGVTTVYETTVPVSGTEKVDVTVPDDRTAKIQQVKIVYSSPELSSTGYALGQNFHPGTVEITAELDKQSGGEGKLSIDKIENHAGASLVYQKWDATGSNQSEELKVTLNKSAQIDNTFEKQDAPRLKVEKSADPTTVQLRDTVTYRVKLTNTSTDEAELKDLMFVDLLPQGAELSKKSTSGDEGDTTQEPIRITEGEGFSITSTSTIPVGESTAVLVYLNGSLGKDESVTVELDAVITNAAIAYQNPTVNYVFAGSTAEGVLSDANRTGAAFKNNNGEWPTDLISTARNAGVDEERQKALGSQLPNLSTEGFVSSKAEVAWTGNSNITLQKSGYGDLDAKEGYTYSTSRLARVSNNGSMYYRLNVMNPESSQETYTNLTVMDVLPQDGDVNYGGTSRDSEWPLHFEEIETVSIIDKEGQSTPITDYEVYYYTGSVNNSSVYGAAKTAQTTIPAGWTTDRGQNTEEGWAKDVTAFIIKLPTNTELAAGSQLIVTYRTKAESYSVDKLNEISYKNANNRFICHYSSYFTDIGNAEGADSADLSIESNVVSATIVPEQVKVGGDVWIDADDSGTQNGTEVDAKGKMAEMYLEYDIVKNLLSELDITLYKYTDTQIGRDQSPGIPKEFGKSEQWDGHFEFDQLDASILTVQNEEDAYVDDELNADVLKGSEPPTYIIKALLPEGSPFTLTKPGSSKKSRKPDSIPAEETTDNNFDSAENQVRSERFFLWPENSVYDYSKDIGFQLHRNVIITKEAADDQNTKLSGATFTVYGPFDIDDEITKDDLSNGKEYTTGEDGTVTIPGLLWFKKYVIVETGHPEGYEETGATASGNNIVPLEGVDNAWVLNVPGIHDTATVEYMTVENVRQTEVPFNVTKILDGRDALKNDEFTFELLEAPDSDSKDAISTVTIKAAEDPETGKLTFPQAAFAPVTLTGVDTFTYYIREKIPADAVNNKKDGISYDTTIYQVQVTTHWDADKKILYADNPVYKVYEAGSASGSDIKIAQFNNIYEATTSWTPEATKTLLGRDMADDESFTFSVREIPFGESYDKNNLTSYREVSSGTVNGGTDGQPVAISFTPIKYTLKDLGTHTYVIHEMNGNEVGGTEKGVTYSEHVVVATVRVTDNGNGTLGTEVDYETTDRNFTNTYESFTAVPYLAAKKVTGGNITSGFKFNVYSDETMNTLDKIHVAVNPVSNINGNILFNFSFSQNDLKGVSGEYPKSNEVVFYIKEAASQPNGYTGSSEVYELTYTVTDDGNGTLTATQKSIRYKKSESAEWSSSLPEDYGSTMTFTNTYEASGKAQVVAKKVLNGKTLEANEFEFALTALDGAPLDENVSYVVKNAADGSITFPEISYDMSDLEVIDKETGEITYPPRDFTYVLTEVADSDKEHYEYDGTQHEVKVTVTDQGDGNLATEITYPDQETPVFTNYYKIDGTLTFSGEKILTEQEILEKQFSFILTSEEKDGAEQDEDNLDKNNKTLIQETDVQADGSFSFNPLKYDQNDVGHTYHYTLREVGEDNTNYDYDETLYEFKVTITDKGGTLFKEVVDVTEYPTGTEESSKAQIIKSEGNVFNVVVSFTNHYKAKGGLKLQAEKTVENRTEAVKAGEFTIDVFEVDNEQLGSNPVATGATSDGGAVEINFGDSYYQISFGMSAEQRNQILGTHTYILRERIPEGAVRESDGKIVYDEIVYSNTAYKVTVEVTDNRDGTLSAKVTGRSKLTVTSGEYWKEEGNALQEDEAMEFVNTYLADGDTPIILNKTLTGSRKDGIGAGEFTFQAQKVSEVGAEPADDARTYTGTTVKASEDTPYETTAEITIPFDQNDLGENIYKLTESATTADSVDTSNAVYYVAFTVWDAGSHRLEATDITYYQADGDGWKELTGNDVPEFVNAYAATGTISLEGKKELTGNRAKALEDGEFIFEIVDEKDQIVSTGTNDADGKITFTAIDPYPADDKVNTYTEADIGETYTYTIREVDKANDAVSVETKPIQIQIHVEDGDGKGKLSVTLTGDVTEEDIVFTNHYNANINTAFKADKILEGGRGTDIGDDEFKFVAQLVSADADQQATYNGSYDAATKKVVFDTMTFDEDDIGRTYTYRISETEGSDDNIEYSKEVFYATVSIEDSGVIGDDGEGILTSTVKYYEDPECVNELPDGITFTNHYQATGRVQLEATKKLNGREMAAGEFIFGVYEITKDSEGNTIRTQVLDAEGKPLYAFNDASGNIVFAEIEYNQDDQGTHEYEIVEFNGKAESITYDDQPVKVSVTVRDEHGNGRLTVDPIYESGEGAHTEFTNTYQADGSVTFTGLKRMLGNRAMEIYEDEFTFTVTEDGQKVATGRTLDGGIIEFTTIEYDENDVNDPDDPEDVHTYVISENMGKDESVSYTAPDVTVTVKVTDNTDGTLTAVPTYPEGGVVFENQYFAEGEITLTGTKELLGNRGTELADGEFQFEIRELDENGDPGEEPVAYGENKADGTIAFDPITYKVEEGRSDIGTHVYVINEVTGGNAAVDYTEDVFEVTVEVTDFGRGTLEAAVVTEESDEVLFQNHYRASGEVLLDNFTKTLNGSPLAAGQFTFQLKDEEGNVLQTVTNAADGSIPFEALTYDESDIGQEYTYTVSEVNNNVTGVAYDTTIYTVIVAVADSENSDGTLDITTTILNGEETIEGEEGELPSITFTNTFGGTVTLTKQNDSQQVLAGAEFQLYARTEGADTYEVYASEGNAEGRYTTDVNGQIQITALPANDYYFVETRAPQGYVIETDEAGQPLHYDFTIGVQDGVAGIAENAVVNAALTVSNDGATTGSIQVTKRVGRIGDNFDIVDLIAVNETYYVGLFLDAAGTQPYGTDNVKAIQMNGVSVSEAVTFDNLPSGTYYVLETDAQGNPIVMNETQTTADGESYYCTLEEGQNNQVTVDLTVSEEPGAVMLTNVYLEFSEDYYWDATIDITKRVLRNGEEATADDTFYAGVYQMLEDGSYELLTEVELQQNDTVTVTGLGGPIGESMTYYVFETDGNGNRVSEDPAFRYAVSGEGSVTVTQDNTAGSITITNEYEEEEPTEEPSEKPTEKPSERPTEPTTKSTDAKDTEPTTTTSTKATKTGDTTDLTVELLLMAVAAVLMGTSVYARKRRRNRR